MKSSWETIVDGIENSEVFTTSACLGMNSLSKEKADIFVEILKLPARIADVMEEASNKVLAQKVPTDLCIYRFYEIVVVHGETLKELIHESGGDGIVRAIDQECWMTE